MPRLGNFDAVYDGGEYCADGDADDDLLEEYQVIKMVAVF